MAAATCFKAWSLQAVRYGCYGKPASRASAKGKVPYAYYRCTGSDAYQLRWPALCWNKPLRTDVLDAAVWEDIVASCPSRAGTGGVRAAAQGPETGPEREVKHEQDDCNVKKMISRLIDAYGDGLLDKSEFEPRILAAQSAWPSWRMSVGSGLTRPTRKWNCGW